MGTALSWNLCTDGSKTLKIGEGYIIKKFTADIKKESQLDWHFIIEFQNSKVEHVKLSEHFFYQSFYYNERIYSIAKSKLCILMYIKLAKGSPKAISESLYASMRYQQQRGGQTNWSLVRRTTVNWSLPALVNCESIISEAVTSFIKEMKNFLHRGTTSSLQIEQKSTKHPKLSITLKVKKDVAVSFLSCQYFKLLIKFMVKNDVSQFF